jgi:hypothetical protein
MIENPSPSFSIPDEGTLVTTDGVIISSD